MKKAKTKRVRAKSAPRTMAQRTIQSMTEGLDILESGGQLTRRQVHFTQPPQKISAAQVARIRKKMACSQSVLADLLNVSPKTVQSWEHNLSRPSGPALRLLQMIQRNPESLIQVARSD